MEQSNFSFVRRYIHETREETFFSSLFYVSPNDMEEKMKKWKMCLVLLLICLIACDATKLTAIKLAAKTVKKLKHLAPLPLLLVKKVCTRFCPYFLFQPVYRIKQKPLVIVIKKNCVHPDFGLGGFPFVGSEWLMPEPEPFHPFPPAYY